jgi:uncharacterized protein YkwD
MLSSSARRRCGARAARRELRGKRRCAASGAADDAARGEGDARRLYDPGVKLRTASLPTNSRRASGASGAVLAVALLETARRRSAAAVPAVLLAVAACLAAARAARADAIAVINALRTEGCGKEAPVGTPVRPDLNLDAVARALSHKSKMQAAFDQVAYPVTNAASFHVHGSRQDTVVHAKLAAGSCTTVEDPRYTDIGVFSSGEDTWVVLAARRRSPPPLNAAAVEQRVLELTNAARAESRRCGDDLYPAAPPVTLSPRLYEAALDHSRDMAEHGLASHLGTDGSRTSERITRAGYAWRVAGENVAAGQHDPDAVVAAWLASPGHCATLMQAFFTEMGVAFALAPSQDPSIYWTQDFAAPLAAPP